MVQLCIRAVSNHCYTVTITQSQIAVELLEMISNHEGIPLSLLKVLHGKTYLNPHATLKNQGIRTGSSLTVGLRLQGGGCFSSKTRVPPSQQIQPQSSGDRAMEVLLRGTNANDDLLVLQGLRGLEGIAMGSLKDPSGSARKLILSVFGRDAEGLYQPIKEKIAAFIPVLLNIMLSDSQSITARSKSELAVALKSAKLLVKKSELGGPELDFYLIYQSRCLTCSLKEVIGTRTRKLSSVLRNQR